MISAQVANRRKCRPLCFSIASRGGKIGKDDQAEHQIERLDQQGVRNERCGDDETDRRQIEDEQPVAEPVGRRRTAFVKLLQSGQHRRLRVACRTHR